VYNLRLTDVTLEPEIAAGSSGCSDSPPMRNVERLREAVGGVGPIREDAQLPL